MGEIIDFNQKKAEIEGTSIIYEDRIIKIYGDVGHIYIFLDSKNKYDIRRITENGIRDMLYRDLQYIYKKQISMEKQKAIWEAIKKSF